MGLCAYAGCERHPDGMGGWTSIHYCKKSNDACEPKNMRGRPVIDRCVAKWLNRLFAWWKR